jgi:malate dehydrogenase (oxaloacetate-decarboxylating)
MMGTPSAEPETPSLIERTLQFHLGGKIEVQSRVPVKTRDELSMAYTPGVARVCEAIRADADRAFQYTIKRNTVAVVSDGTAVLGLGDIGPRAAMPVMEGKAMLFKELAGVDAFPICLDTRDPDEIVACVRALSPGFGGVNLEDISAPRCFEIEDRLRSVLDIPVFHDDQHGTAVVVLAALLNALRLTGRSLGDLRIVIVGMGAAGVAVTRILLGAGASSIVGVDSRGALSVSRSDYLDGTMHPVKRALAEERALAEATRELPVGGGVADERRGGGVADTQRVGGGVADTQRVGGGVADERRGGGGVANAQRVGGSVADAQRVGGGVADVLEGADVFIGLSGARVVDASALARMNPDPIVFAMANPVPEVAPEEAAPYARIIATGRSDYPNQINNVLCFPGLFRGALDVRAVSITEAMKVAAAQAIASIVGDDELREDYIIPSVFNRDVAPAVAAAVASEARSAGLAAAGAEVGFGGTEEFFQLAGPGR